MNSTMQCSLGLVILSLVTGTTASLIVRKTEREKTNSLILVKKKSNTILGKSRLQRT